jgi:oligoribonuclease
MAARGVAIVVVSGMSRAGRLLWADLEMTGLDPFECVVVEIATIVTEANLDIVAEGPNIVVHQPDEALAKMNEVVQRMHDSSGLTEAVRASTVSLREAEQQTLAFVREHCDQGVVPLCGNSIWKDRQFVERYMPELDGYLHYRNVDVSSLKELVRRWYPDAGRPPAKQESHRALDDIRESIEELRWYRQQVFVAAAR